MKKMLGVALVATTAFAGVAHAGPTLSGNIGLSSDYTFRGVSQTEEAPAVQGGFDYTNEAGGLGYYAGVWASNVDLSGGHIEMDVYAGLRPRITEKLTADVGVIGYFYPGAHDDGAELDYLEAFGKLNYEATDKLKLGAAVYFSPEFTGETGTAVYGEISAEYRISKLLAVSGAYGYQQADDGDFSASVLSVDHEYQTWNLGLTMTPGGVMEGLAFDLRYVGTDIEDVDAADDRAVLSVKKAL